MCISIARFLLENYKQALTNVKNLSIALDIAMRSLNIDSRGVFEQWHDEEARYLQALKAAPKNASLTCKYVKTLKTLAEWRYVHQWTC